MKSSTHAEQAYSQPNKIRASTPFQFNGSNLTAYRGLLPLAAMLEKRARSCGEACSAMFPANSNGKQSKLGSVLWLKGSASRGMDRAPRADRQRPGGLPSLRRAALLQSRPSLSRQPCRSGLPNDVDEADLAQVRLFIGDRDYVGRVVVRPFDPMRTGATAPRRAPAPRPARR